MNEEREAQSREDGWANELTGIGMLNMDKRMSSTATYQRLSEGDCEELYASDDVAAAIVDRLPEDGLREWIAYRCDPELAKTLETEVDRLGVAAKFQLAWQWARLYGGAAVLMLVDGPGQLSQPLDPSKTRAIRALTVLQRYELEAIRESIDLELSSPTYGRPLLYEYRRKSEADWRAIRIHASRMILFDGAKLPMRMHINNGYWDDSELAKTHNSIRNYSTSHDAAATLMQEINQPVFKIKGLAQMLANDKQTLLTQRFRIIQLCRSIAHAVPVDSEEEFQNVSVSVTGVPDLLKQIGQRLVTASRMPHTILLGDSPTGMAQTGRTEERTWYAYVGAQQDRYLRPRLDRFFDVLFACRWGVTGGRRPDPWAYEFKPLWQADEKEQAETRKLQAEIDSIYIERGVLFADEVAENRFGSGQYSTETAIDMKEREELARPPAAEEEEEEEEGEPPPRAGAGGAEG